MAEIACEHLKKGSKVYLEASLRTRAWQDDTGNQRYVTEVIADRLTMLTGRAEMPEGAASEQEAPAEPSEPMEADDSVVLISR